ncbi:MAG: hypothetical protein HW377_1218 [Actinobacteria bacterium]|nr:hypothetical protein [Actinomycetota bacterium]
MNTPHPPPVLPPAPIDLVAVAVGGWQVILAWTECRAGGRGFRIERADGIGAACLFSEIGKTGANVAAFLDESVKPRTTYSYLVRAWNVSGDSSPTKVVEVTTPEVETETIE